MPPPSSSEERHRALEQQRQTGNWYDIAQVCPNGHTATYVLVQSPELGEAFCHVCGVRTLTECLTCGAFIRGYWHRTWVVDFGFEYTPPNNCYECGRMYPWTAKKLEAARELADELSLSEQETLTFKERLPDIVQNTPRAQASAVILRRLLGHAEQAGSVAVGVLREMLVDISAKAIAETLKP